MNRIFNISRGDYFYEKYYEKMLRSKFTNKKYSDNKLIIFKTEGGNIFGAYKSFILEQKDDKGFIFSITNNKIFFTDCNDYSTVHANGDFEVVNYFYLTKNKKEENVLCKSLDIGEGSFYLSKFEIFRVEFLSK